MSESNNRTFHHESLQAAGALADHLIEIAEAVRAGTLVLRDDQGEMALEPTGLVRFELTGFQQPDRAGVSISLAWSPEPDLPESTLKISRTTNDGSTGP